MSGEQGLRIGLVQLEIRDGDPARNLARAAELIRGATPADLFLLPELWTTGYTHASWPDQARESTPRTCAALASLARELGVWIGGSLISKTDRGLANRFWLSPPDGGPAATYDKVHLFPALGEPDCLVAGRRRVAVRVGDWAAALSICYDLRFPEMYRLDAVDGAALFLVVAEWPAARADALRLLARARAVENQAFLALCNRTGVAADGTAFGGGSLVVGPDGTLLADAGDREGVVVAAIEPHAVREARSAMPVLSGRVPGVDTARAAIGMEPAPVRPGGLR